MDLSLLLYHYHFSEGLARVNINEQWGFIDKTGKIAIAPQFEFASPFSEELAAVRIGGKWGYTAASLAQGERGIVTKY